MCRCGLGGGLDFHDAEAAVRAVLIANSLHSCAARAAPQRDAHAAAPSKSNAARDSRGTRARKRAHTHATRARTQTQPTFVSPMQCVVLINTELLLVSQCPRKTDGAALLLQRARPAAPASDARACARSGALAADAARELDALGLDRDAPRVDRAEVRVLEEPHEVRLRRLQLREHRGALEAQVRLELTARSRARGAGRGACARRLLVAPDLADLDGARSVRVRLLYAACRLRAARAHACAHVSAMAHARSKRTASATCARPWWPAPGAARESERE